MMYLNTIHCADPDAGPTRFVRPDGEYHCIKCTYTGTAEEVEELFDSYPRHEHTRRHDT